MLTNKMMIDGMRKADLMQLPDRRKEFIEPYVENGGGEKPPCCAIGGANIANGLVDIRICDLNAHISNSPQLLHVSIETAVAAQQFPPSWSVTHVPLCPDENCYGYEDMSTRLTVMHLYDFHLWSRAKIADWLETLDITD